MTVNRTRKPRRSQSTRGRGLSVLKPDYMFGWGESETLDSLPLWKGKTEQEIERTIIYHQGH